jgi:hypothetical protein
MLWTGMVRDILHEEEMFSDEVRKRGSQEVGKLKSHLLLHRFIAYALPISPAAAIDFWGMIRYCCVSQHHSQIWSRCGE